MDDAEDKDSSDFLNLLDSLRMEQYVVGSTHHSGYRLDLVLTRTRDKSLPSFILQDDIISDHYPILCDLSLQQMEGKRQVVTY